MGFSTFNPATGEKLSDYSYEKQKCVECKILKAQNAFESYRQFSLEDRVQLLNNLAEVLDKHQEKYAYLMTNEMGKPIAEARAEIAKCADMTRVYAENAVKWLEEKKVDADGKEHLVRLEPVGVVLSIMPWNFPFWQALRFGVPTLLVGNVTLLKHSDIVPGCALALQDAFVEAGFPEAVFQTLIIDHELTGKIIGNDIIKGVSLTGSTRAGSQVAEICGKHLKKVVLELGGSDPFIVLDDADIEKAVAGGVLGRFMNGGQSCIAAKRFIVLESIAQQFSDRFVLEVEKKIMGDPQDEDVHIGPLVNKVACDQIEGQVQDAIDKGARVLTGALREGDCFYTPTVLTNINPEMNVYSEEVFGPVASIIVVKSDEEATSIANQSQFGLGGSVWSKNLDRAKDVASKLECGTTFVNSIVKSDPRMPFGGVKKSGIGRELSWYGLYEFANIKAYNIYES